jgi:cytochrome c553
MNARRVIAGAMISFLTAAPSAGAEAPPGASSCSGCHAARSGVDAMAALAGRTDITEAMLAFKSGGRPATIMDRIAKGFSDDETRALAAWYAAQKPAARTRGDGVDGDQ